MSFDLFVLLAVIAVVGAWLLWNFFGSLNAWLDSMAAKNRAEAKRIDIVAQLTAMSLPMDDK